MKILHISDTHNNYNQLIYNTDVDVVVHTGDAECYTSLDFEKFLDWYSKYPIENKIYVAGNHDVFIERTESMCKKLFEEAGIIYLNKKSVVIDGVKFYGDPIVPRYGNWSFMTDRNKLNKHWDYIPEDVNVLLTHTPAKGILDLTENRNGHLELCGCGALEKRLKTYKDLKLHCFGHIHNVKHIVNTGLRIIDGITFSNATGVIDGRFDLGLTYHGNIIEI